MSIINLEDTATVKQLRITSEEAADVAICFEVLINYFCLNVEGAVNMKFPVLYSRKWTVNEDGVVLRSGRTIP